MQVHKRDQPVGIGIEKIVRQQLRQLNRFRAARKDAANDRVQRFRLYEELARRTLDPVGGVWGDGSTAFAFDGESDELVASMDAARRLWTELVNDGETTETHEHAP